MDQVIIHPEGSTVIYLWVIISWLFISLAFNLGLEGDMAHRLFMWHKLLQVVSQHIKQYPPCADFEFF